jgi:hypothetical protein
MMALALALLAGTAAAQSESASSWTGRVRAGGIYLDETGDATTMPETFNIYDGFTLSSIYLKGHAGPRSTLLLDLSDINQDGRRGTLDFRQTGILHIRRHGSPSNPTSSERMNSWPLPRKSKPSRCWPSTWARARFRKPLIWSNTPMLRLAQNSLTSALRMVMLNPMVSNTGASATRWTAPGKLGIWMRWNMAKKRAKLAK